MCHTVAEIVRHPLPLLLADKLRPLDWQEKVFWISFYFFSLRYVIGTWGLGFVLLRVFPNQMSSVQAFILTSYYPSGLVLLCLLHLRTEWTWHTALSVMSL